MKMAKSKDTISIQRNKDIGELIKQFYEKYVGTKPDSTHYAAGHKILDPLMNNPDENLRCYNLIEMLAVLAYLDYMGVALKNITILHYPNLVSSIINKDVDVASANIERIIAEQEKNGVYSEKAIENQRPAGW